MQYEVDHLDGILSIMRATGDQGKERKTRNISIFIGIIAFTTKKAIFAPRKARRPLMGVSGYGLTNKNIIRCL